MKLNPRSLPRSLVTLLALILLPSATRAEIDPFYRSLLQEGIQQYDLRDFAASARTLRLACFGMLDEPAELGSCFVRLALAQDRNNDPEGFLDTFRRLAEVEERFQGYTKSSLSPELRADLEQRLIARVPAATLRSIPVFRGLADRKAETKPTETKPAETKLKAGTKPAGSAPKSGASGTSNTVGQPAGGQAVASQPAAPRSLTGEEREGMTRVRKVLAEPSPIKDLRQAFDVARQMADAHPDSVEAQHLAAEAAYRVSRWSDAARYFLRGGEPADDQPELLFYMAVALYESGDQARAAEVLKRSLPNLQRTPYVDTYARKILG